MSTRRSVLVLGANGRLGRAATLAFAAAGWRVLAQARRVPIGLPAGVVHLAADLADSAALEAELASSPGLRSVVVRAGDFFGGDLPGTWIDLAIAKSLGRGKLAYPGPLDLPHAWAYLPDLARAFVAVASHDDGRAPHRRLHFAGHTPTGRELLAGIEAAAAALHVVPGRAWRHTSFPWPLIRAAGLVWPLGRELAAMSYLWRVPHALDGGALRAAVGELPQTPLHDALVAALQALGHGARTAPA